MQHDALVRLQPGADQRVVAVVAADLDRYADAPSTTTGFEAMIIDAWAQHPTLRQMQDPMFDSLRRWTRTAAPTAIGVAIAVGVAIEDVDMGHRHPPMLW